MINPKNPDDGPMIKSCCGMVPYKKSLVIFGEYGDAPTHPQPGASYQGRMTNELHLLDLVEGECIISPYSFIRVTSRGGRSFFQGGVVNLLFVDRVLKGGELY